MDLHDDLDGQVALVTGATRGIGAQIARNLRELGATVYAGARSVSDDVPEGCERVLIDVTQEGDIEAVADGIFGESGRLDVLVNNAGVCEFGDDIVAEPTDRIDRTLATNLRGPMLSCKHLVPLLVQQSGGRVVNVSSRMGQLAEMSDGSPAYRVSKVGLNGLTRYLDAQYAEQGLIANSASPGWVRTDMGGPDANRSVEAGAETPTWLCRFAQGAPSGGFWHDKERIEW